MNKPLFLNKGKHIYCCRHFLEHGESAKGGWGDSGVCCFKECTMPQIILWNLLFCTNENFGICVLEQKQSHLPTPAPLLFVIFLFFPLAFTAIKSECSPQVSTFTLQDGGSVPAELPADGCTVDGGGREHQGAVQRLHWGRQVSLRVVSRFKTWWEQSSIQFQYWC